MHNRSITLVDANRIQPTHTAQGLYTCQKQDNLLKPGLLQLQGKWLDEKRCSNPRNLFQTLRSKLLSDTACFSCPSGAFLTPTSHLPRCAALTVSYLFSCPPPTRESCSATVTPCKLWLSTLPMEAGSSVLPVLLPTKVRYSKHCQLSQCRVPV